MSSPPQSIVFLSFNDWCGTAFKFHEAVKPHVESSHHIVYHNVTLDYGREICIACDGTRLAQRWVDEADYLVFVGDDPIDLTWKWPQSDAVINIPAKTPKALVTIGSYFRRCNDAAISSPLCDQARIMRHTDARFVITPDLNYDWFKASYVPLPYAARETPYAWRHPLSTETFRVSHSPTVRAKKGTETVVAAVNRLRRDGVNIELDIIENTPYRECVERKRHSHLFVEDLRTGFWGYSAIEAAAFGVPVVTNVNKELLGEYPMKFPFMHCDEDADRLAAIIYDFINHATSTRALQIDELSRRTKKFAEAIHDYSVIGPKLLSLLI